MTADSPASGLPQEAVEQRLRFLASKSLYRDATICLDAVAALAAERAKVAALQQAVDKVRALHNPVHYCEDKRGGRDWYGPGGPCPTVALLPDVQADDRGTATPTPATTCADCGTTRTVCDAGLNTYDTRCCEQCGHGEGK